MSLLIPEVILTSLIKQSNLELSREQVCTCDSHNTFKDTFFLMDLIYSQVKHLDLETIFKILFLGWKCRLSALIQDISHKYYITSLETIAILSLTLFLFRRLKCYWTIDWWTVSSLFQEKVRIEIFWSRLQFALGSCLGQLSICDPKRCQCK